MTALNTPSAAKANRAIGAMFFSVFGTVWLIGGDIIARGGADWTLLPIVAAGACLALTAWHRFQANRVARAAMKETPQAKKIGRAFNWINGAQWVLVIILSNVLRNTGLGHWVVSMIIAVVGLHFLPLAVVMGYRPHYVTGLALVVLAIVSPFVASAGAQSEFGLFGAGLVLWASAVFALALGHRPPVALADMTLVRTRIE